MRSGKRVLLWPSALYWHWRRCLGLSRTLGDKLAFIGSTYRKQLLRRARRPSRSVSVAQARPHTHAPGLGRCTATRTLVVDAGEATRTLSCYRLKPLERLPKDSARARRGVAKALKRYLISFSVFPGITAAAFCAGPTERSTRQPAYSYDDRLPCCGSSDRSGCARLFSLGIERLCTNPAYFLKLRDGDT
jgi:hypothetical protein